MHFAIVGSGPSGFYAAEALLRADPSFRVDLLDRLPTPFGLVRGGVAPDHPKIKLVSLAYDRIAKNERLRFFGNVHVGRDISVAELRGLYHAVVLACGAERDRRLEIPGEGLEGSYGAAEFVGWYNGHPDHSGRRFDLSHEVAVIVGQGNVAADICRMLATPVEALAATDIPQYALDALAQSRIRTIHIVGRRGPAQAKFTSFELKELGEIPGCRAVVDARDLDLNEQSRLELTAPQAEISAKNVEIFSRFAAIAGADGKLCRFRFFETPISINGQARVESITLARNRLSGRPFAQIAEATGESVELDCGVIFRSIGFSGLPPAGVPFDPVRATVPSRSGRILDAAAPVAGLYATGWIKRGPSGVIGTNRADSAETVKSLLEDLPLLRSAPRPGGIALDKLLGQRGIRFVPYGDWLRLDAMEQDRGRARGKPREKFCAIGEMLEALGGEPAAAS